MVAVVGGAVGSLYGHGNFQVFNLLYMDLRVFSILASAGFLADRDCSTK